MGFLSEGGQVSFSIDTPDDTLFQEYGVELRTKVMEHLDGRMTVTIEIVDYKKGEKEEQTSSTFPPISSRPTATPPSATSPEPVILPSEGDSNYDDTDYGVDNDGMTNYSPPASGTPVPEDTDYGPDNDGVTDYHDGNTDYNSNNEDDTDYDNDDDIDDDDSEDDDSEDDDSEDDD